MAALTGEIGAERTSAGFANIAVRREAARILREHGVTVDAPPDSDAEARWRHKLLIARTFEAELQSPRFTYTTDLSDFRMRPGEDPIALFLTENKLGHCEHFASAMTAMCRSVGVEARLVTGYIAMEYDDGASQYVVRESNAHAWVEVRSGTFTWATFDPTPTATLDALNAANSSWFDQWRWMYDRVEFMWNNRFVGFDGRTQATLVERVGAGWSGWLRNALESVQAFGREVNAFFRLGPAGYIWLGLVGLVVIVAAIAVVTVARRIVALRRAVGLRTLSVREARRLMRDLGFYLDTLLVLERAGCPKPAWQPPQTFARDLRAQRPDAAEIVEGLVRRFYAVRYGGEALDAGQVRAARAEVDRLARTLREVPRPRER
jgi:hypothetical protein